MPEDMTAHSPHAIPDGFPAEAPAAGSASAAPMSRRGMVRNTAAVGVGAASLLAFGGASASAEPARTTAAGAATGAAAPAQEQSADRDAPAEQPVVVHLRDSQAGVMDFFHGEQRSEVRDPALAAMILRKLR